MSHADRTRFFVISNIASLNLLRHFKHLEFKLQSCDVFSLPDIPPTVSANVLMSSTISNKNRLGEGLEYVACLRGHIGTKFTERNNTPMLYLFFSFSVPPRLFMHGLTSKKTNSENTFNRTTCPWNDSPIKKTFVNTAEWSKKPIKVNCGGLYGSVVWVVPKYFQILQAVLRSFYLWLEKYVIYFYLNIRENKK